MLAQRESKFQADLIRDIRSRFPGCIVLKNDPNYLQGVPDLLVLYGRHWASLECKKDSKAPYRPNQEYYIGMMNDMSFSSVIYPENREEVLNELQQSFET